MTLQETTDQAGEPIHWGTALAVLGFERFRPVLEGIGAPGGAAAPFLPAAQAFWREYLQGFDDRKDHFPRALELFFEAAEATGKDNAEAARKWALRQYIDFKRQSGWDDWSRVFGRVAGKYPRYPLAPLPSAQAAAVTAAVARAFAGVADDEELERAITRTRASPFEVGVRDIYRRHRSSPPSRLALNDLSFALSRERAHRVCSEIGPQLSGDDRATLQRWAGEQAAALQSAAPYLEVALDARSGG